MSAQSRDGALQSAVEVQLRPGILRRFGRMTIVDAAGVAAHGSVSAVTFIAAQQFVTASV